MNNTDSSSCAAPEGRTHTAVILETTLITIVSVMILVLNIGNLAVMRRIKHWHKSTIHFVINLTFSDLCVAVFSASAILPSIANNPLRSGSIFCQIGSFLGGCSASVSLMTLAYISVDRYFIIAHPFRHRSLMSKRNISIMVAASWSISGILYMWVFVEDILGTMCNPDSQLCFADLTDHSMFVLVLLIFIYLPANVTIVYCYGSILYIARVQSARIRKQESVHSPPGRSSSQKGNYKAAWLFIAIFGMFNICWAPFVCLVVFRVVCRVVFEIPDPTPHWIKFVVPWMTMSNSFVNVFIYFGLNSQYRAAVRRLLCRVDKDSLGEDVTSDRRTPTTTTSNI